MTPEEQAAFIDAIAPLFAINPNGYASLNIQGGLKFSNGDKVTVLFSDADPSQTITLPNMSGRLLAENSIKASGSFIKSTTNPSQSEIPEGSWVMWYNSTSNELKIWANLNNKMYHSAKLVNP